MKVVAIHDELHESIRIQGCAHGAGFAVVKRPHGVEKVQEKGSPGFHGFPGGEIVGIRVAQGGDSAQAEDFGKKRKSAGKLRSQSHNAHEFFESQNERAEGLDIRRKKKFPVKGPSSSGGNERPLERCPQKDGRPQIRQRR
jgi:hypothetical protein